MGSMNPPDPSSITSGTLGTGAAIGAQQTQANQQAQQGSMVNQNNPYGSLSYSQTGTGANGTPIYTANTTLTPQQQQLFNTLQGTQQQAGNTAGGDISTGNNLLGTANSMLPGANQNINTANQTIGNANYGGTNSTAAIGNETSGLTGQLMNQYMAGVTPFQTTQTSQLDTQLRNQGLAPGNPAYDNAMRQNVSSQTLANDQAEAQFEPQAFQQATTEYQMPATIGSELSGIGGQQATTGAGEATMGAGEAGLGTGLAQFGAPGSVGQNLVNAPQLQPANYVGAAGVGEQGSQAAYDAQMQQYSGMMNGIFGIGSDALSALAFA
jgi:hypothetical protein